MASIGCRNADYCLRSFGTINGQNGSSFASCVTRANFNTTCQNYPACLATKSSNSDFTTCCCKTDLCNDDSFAGDSSPLPTTTESSAQKLATNSAFAFIALFFIFA
uniref:Uncharacterized protein n=1 Tax=Panagrolaimus sp. JU765 TaxID=591449 RepID=A0AC34QD67_9BILA